MPRLPNCGGRFVEPRRNNDQISQVSLPQGLGHVRPHEIFDFQEFDIGQPFPKHLGARPIREVDDGDGSGGYAVEVEQTEYHHQQQRKKERPEKPLAIARHHHQV